MKRIIKNATNKLRKKKVPEIANSISIIFQQCFHPKYTVQKSFSKKINNFNRKIHLRSFHYPIQYLCKTWQFRQLNLRLIPPVLIPRFQTQYLITLIKQKISEKYEQNFNGLKFVQYGCGSGAIGLSLIKQFNINGKMIDIDQKCIQLTYKNAIINACSISRNQILEADMLKMLDLMDQCDIVVSNPPYLSEQHYKNMLKKQVKSFQDKKALVGGKDGLKFIKILLQKWKSKKGQGLLFIEYDGRNFQHQLQWVNKFVVCDQYGQKRFIIMEK